MSQRRRSLRRLEVAREREVELALEGLDDARQPRVRNAEPCPERGLEARAERVLCGRDSARRRGAMDAVDLRDRVDPELLDERIAEQVAGRWVEQRDRFG